MQNTGKIKGKILTASKNTGENSRTSKKCRKLPITEKVAEKKFLLPKKFREKFLNLKKLPVKNPESQKTAGNSASK